VSTSTAARHVGCDLDLEVDEGGCTLVLQIAPARPAPVADEILVVELDGEPLPVTEIGVAHGGRSHVLQAGAGPLTIRYQASVTPEAPTQDDDPADDTADADALEHLRQSRYAPSDALVAFAERELAALPGGPERAGAVADWVF